MAEKKEETKPTQRQAWRDEKRLTITDHDRIPFEARRVGSWNFLHRERKSLAGFSGKFSVNGGRGSGSVVAGGGLCRRTAKKRRGLKL